MGELARSLPIPAKAFDQLLIDAMGHGKPVVRLHFGRFILRVRTCGDDADVSGFKFIFDRTEAVQLTSTVRSPDTPEEDDRLPAIAHVARQAHCAAIG